MHDASIGENLPSDLLFKDAYCCFGVYKNIHVDIPKKRKGTGGTGERGEVERRGEPQGLTQAKEESGLRENTCIFRIGLHPRCVGSDLSAQLLLVHSSVSALEPLSRSCLFKI